MPVAGEPKQHILSLGKIGRAKGLDGQLHIFTSGTLLIDAPDYEDVSIYTAELVHDGFLLNAEIDSASSKYQLLKVTEVKAEKITARFNNINNRNEAELLSGHYLGIELEKAKQKFPFEDFPYLFHYIDVKLIDDEEHDFILKVQYIEESSDLAWLVATDENTSYRLSINSHLLDESRIKESLVYYQGLKQLCHEI